MSNQKPPGSAWLNRTVLILSMVCRKKAGQILPEADSPAHFHICRNMLQKPVSDKIENLHRQIRLAAFGILFE